MTTKVLSRFDSGDVSDYVSEISIGHDFLGKLLVFHRHFDSFCLEITEQVKKLLPVIHRPCCTFDCIPEFCSCETEGFEASYRRASLRVVSNLTDLAMANHQDRRVDSDKDRKALSLLRNSGCQIYRFEATASQRSVAK